MDLSSLLPFGVLLGTSFLAALAALWAATIFIKRPNLNSVLQPGEPDVSVCLFDGHMLISKENYVEAEGTDDLTDWDRFRAKVGSQFDGFDEAVASLPESGRVSLRSADGSVALRAEWVSGLVRITVSSLRNERQKVSVDNGELEAMRQELKALREMVTVAPHLLWRQKSSGEIVWANSSYLDLAQKGLPADAASSWPPVRLFEALDKTESPGAKGPERISVRIAGEPGVRWFEYTQTQVGDETLFMAVSADRVVEAEVKLRDFMQTLTKTFAQLTVGLAIFDKNRRLVLFNPALSDLTTAPVDFLSARPSLYAFLDRLREKNILPEPKDYKSWRQQFQELESAATDGSYEDTWSLANGQTFRVIGRPHPDGAVAFLFEDISAEISLTRRFRAELENGQAVLDSFDEAIAVFSPAGTLTISNTAYTKLWRAAPSTIIGNSTILEATCLWSESCAPSPIWGDVREFVSSVGEKVEWTAEARLLNGQRLLCRFTPISGGATLVGFKVATPKVVQQTPESRVPKLLEGEPTTA